MIRVGLGIVAVAALLASLALDEPGRAREAESGAGKLFTDRCADCHAVPDPAVRTDRAWLDQIKRTT